MLSTRRLVAAAVLAAFLSLPAVAAADSSSLHVRGRLVTCLRALDPANRVAVLDGRVRTTQLKDRLWIRFDVQRRGPGDTAWQSVGAPGLGDWRSSDVGVNRFHYRKRVTNLDAPARYRAVVSFKATDAAGNTVASATRTTAVCTQPDPRPELVLAGTSYRAIPGSPDAAYTAVIRNTGRSTANDFTVTLAVDGAIQDPVSIAFLRPGARRVVRIQAPRCRSGVPLEWTADAGGAVAEPHEDDNVRDVACP